MHITKERKIGLLAGYMLIILGGTVLFRIPFAGQHFQPRLFWSYAVWTVQRKQIIINVIIFIPLGYFAAGLLKWKGIAVGLGLSVLIEVFQLISQRGLFEFDDILHNTLGTFIGVFICMLAETLVMRKRNKDGLYK